jgi:hypothetical protein
MASDIKGDVVFHSVILRTLYIFSPICAELMHNTTHYLI